MKKKAVIITACVIFVAFICCASVFFSHNTGKMEVLFNDIIKALDSGEGLSELFLPSAVENSETFDEDVKAANEFYNGSSTDITELTIYRESATIYRAYAFVTTDKGETYMVSAALSGARMVDGYGIKLLIIDNKEKHLDKKLFGNERFQKYLSKTREYGISLKTDIPEEEKTKKKK